ncbi:D-glycero-beta-D-manno-heptose 1-phosphate adenylyltransferase [Pseudobacteriovorax antillogorgiicola]|uniref:Bifunctional protein HldE n=1 Tax=Pseudobacteriovorax antillogorgiicola TaxID=1513793 RepID=A0A1Y6CR11_9BACT|nr:D-glycero-beta-D-manno-heptose 1-phosphate adenylyltransferase [Pseudobacteriovorax antillogorgiicola]TCS46109.1 D-alpha,beta-D-heptose 7-phosphate 1-kinase /D-beta-D-heptose 1-phosphate adenylyltransferase [Pseudobacteriovorax antillogorgiicola]SMF69445.1 D-alpha,beta-D-heptose 7-phosphate 1-kinase /D-beta-D-heptose 1-phosphate adenylyltransferase [Pseudobacteriovorax antillogorgiicola]
MLEQSHGRLPWEKTSARVVVVGDLILDEYLDGSVNRISPEAPVPVHLVQSSTATAGGAANVARNIQLVGGYCSIAGVCGNDGAADQLKQILKADDVDIKNIETDLDRPTVRKTRITANHQQLVRIDWEEVRPISQDLQERLLSRVKELSCDALLVSDYGKGSLPPEFLKQLISYAREQGVPVVVDPKGKDYSGYAGADLITPNYKEACEALGLDSNQNWDPEMLASKLKERFDLKNILVTLGAKGMLGLTADGVVHHLAAVKREVFDVSGAGDTVVSIMALAMGSQTGFPEAMRLANLAAGCVVEKWGTQPITKSDLLAALDETTRHDFGWHATGRKIMDRASLKNEILNIQDQGRKIVFTNGCFDLLHAGHIAYLEEARSLGHGLVIGVNSDQSVRQLKGESRPIIPCEQRLALLAALECVDYVVSFDEETPAQLIQDLMPDVLVKGADYELHEIVGADTVTAAGGKVERIAFVDGLSTSDIVRRVKAGEGVSISPQN